MTITDLQRCSTNREYLWPLAGQQQNRWSLEQDMLSRYSMQLRLRLTTEENNEVSKVCTSHYEAFRLDDTTLSGED